MTEPKFPDVFVQLTGNDGNAFAIIGAVQRGLREAGYSDEAKQFSTDAMNSESYDALLRLCMETVEVG